MATKNIIILLSLLALTTHVHSQFYDLFEGFQPFIRSDPLIQTTRKTSFLYPQDNRQKKPKIESSHIRNEEKQTSREYYDSEINHRPTSKPRRKQTTIAQLFNFNIFTTPKPVRKSTKNSSHRNNTTSSKANSRESLRSISRIQNENRGFNTNSGNRRWYEDNVNNVNADIITTRPPHATTKRNYVTTKNYAATRNYYDNSRSNDRNSYFTTNNPLYNKPGVRPAVVDSNLPPITNKPVTNRPLAVYPKPTDSSVIRFPEDPDTSPKVVQGPDGDTMSSVEKKRYIEISERMCDKYKALSVKKLEAIPLLPSPEPVQVNVSTCPPITVPLVVGGKIVTIQEFPHMALLGWTKVPDGGYAWKCGGSLISDQYVLTAGHCSYQEKDDSVAIGAPRAVQLGSSHLDDQGALVVKVLTVITHPKYITTRSYYDIALVKLVKPVTFSEVVKPACLGVPPPVGQPVIATGWGKTEFGGSQSVDLRSVSIPIWDIDECHHVLGTSRKLPQGPSRDSQVCAGDKKGLRDTCQGDSGGPAQIQDGCSWRVVAVTSVGRSCGAPNTPALYATIDKAFVAAQVFGKSILNNNNQNYNHENNNRNQNNHPTGGGNNYNVRNQNNNGNDYNSNGNKNNYASSTNNNNNGNRNQNNNGNVYNSNGNENNYASSSNNNNNGNRNQNNNGNVYNSNGNDNNHASSSNNNNNANRNQNNNGNDYNSNGNQNNYASSTNDNNNANRNRNDYNSDSNFQTNSNNYNSNSNQNNGNNYDYNTQNNNRNNNNNNQYNPWTDSVNFNRNPNNNRQDTYQHNGNRDYDSSISRPDIYQNNPSSSNNRNENRYNNNYNSRAVSNTGRRAYNDDSEYRGSYTTNTGNGGQRNYYRQNENGYNNQRNGNDNYEITFYRPSDYGTTEESRRNLGIWSSYGFK